MNLKEFDIDVKTVCQQDEICLSVLQAHKTTTILLKENKDNTVKLTRKWWDKKEQLILTGKEVIYF